MSDPVIPHSRPTLGEEEAQAVAEVVRSGQIAQNGRVPEFERAMAAYFGLPGGVAVSSGTVALELALLALGIEPGDEVILPSYVCSSPWLAIQRVGAQPRLVDIEPATFALDPDKVKGAMTANTRAVIVPHPFGLPADLKRLQQLGVPLIEDCAQTLGGTQHGTLAGTVGEVTICSFYATKILCTGEGGMVLSRDAAMLEKVLMLREYDEQPSLTPAAYNRKLTQLQAAMGRCQVAKIPRFLERRQRIASAYERGFKGAGVTLPVVPPDRTHMFYRYVVMLPDPVGWTTSNRAGLDTLIGKLERRGVR
ncbi:MAG: DegT/DnrJ/EryC1/StrS family aminotransferase, partial [Nitrospirales bacterium]